NARGDYLAHPDSSREFAFDLGGESRWDGDFPEFTGRAIDGAVRAEGKAPDGERRCAAAAGASLAGGPRVTIIEAAPFRTLRAVAAPVIRAQAIAGFAALVAALIVSVALARALTAPLRRLTQAMATFTGDEVVVAPAGSGPEM